MPRPDRKPESAPRAVRAPADRGGRAPEPVLVRVWRGDFVESSHRGSWALADAGGRVLAAAGDPDAPVFARSSIKSLQALPLLESGAADRFGFPEDELALALASHAGEPMHTERVGRMLARLGLGVEALQCGPQPPTDRAARAELARRGERPSALHNNCSGKHAGFLALALHLGVDPARYLDPGSRSQALVRRAVAEMTGAGDGGLTTGVDGCSAPTFRMPLRALATGLARLANPEGLEPARRAACERLARAAAAWPELVAGSHRRLCTDLLRGSGGRLFPKVGGEAVYVVGARGAGRALAFKIADGADRALHPLVIELLERFDLASRAELDGWASWRDSVLRNWAGREVGRVEVLA